MDQEVTFTISNFQDASTVVDALLRSGRSVNFYEENGHWVIVIIPRYDLIGR